MVSLKEFISIFDTNNSITFKEFLKKAVVLVGKKKYTLTEYIKKKHIYLDAVELLYENIQKRKHYLTRFYNTSLKINEPFKINDEPMISGEMNNNKNINYKNLIRNMFFLEILKNTKSGIENNSTYMDVLENLYKRNIIDYKLLTPSAIFYMKQGRLGSVFSSYYFRASIMNPYLVYSLNKSIFKANNVFTPTLGWGSYYYGFAESGIKEYIGVDVIPNVCKKITNFAYTHYPDINTKIICKPSEKLFIDKSFNNEYKGHFDLVFFSPPYFKLEMYEGENQSTLNYPEYSEWLENYWDKTIQLCYNVLKKGKNMCYILSGYGSENTKEMYNLLNDMNNIAKKYFTLEEIQPMYNKNVHVTSHRETAEKIMIFKKE